IATPTIVPPGEPIPIVNSIDKPVVTLVYTRKPKAANKKVPNKLEPNNSWGSSSSNVPSSLLTCGFSKSSSGQFCDSDLEVAFCQHTCFIRNLEGVDLLTARQGLVRGLLKLKFEKDHRYSACAMGKRTKKTHKPKFKDTNQEKLYLLHMDLCGPMRVESVNGKKYILDIVDDYSRFTWVKFLRSKDETQTFIIKFLKMIQAWLNVPVRRIRTDNGTEFFNQTLRDYYEEVGISHETSVARSPQQNGVVKRRNRTLIEAAHTMLIYAQAPLFLWVEDVATACFTQNRSIIRLRHGKTPYELLHSKLPDLSFFHVFGALCYPTNDSENLGKLQPKADIGIFIGYATTKKAFRIYNRRTRRIVKTIHVDFDELTAMASEQSSSGPALNDMTPRTISSGLVRTSSSYVPPSRNDWDLLFQSMFDELLSPPPSVVNQAAKVIAPIAKVIPQADADSTGSPSLTTVDQDVPSPSKSLTTTEIQSTVIPQDVGDDNLDMEVAHMGNDPLLGPKTYKEALTQACWIEAMHEELNKFERLENGVVERRNRTLIEAARTMLIYAQAPLFLRAEAVATACFTQNRSIIRLRHGKTPYELLHNKLPDLSFFYVFGALCYPTNDSENLAPEFIAPIAEVIPQVDADSTSSPSSRTVDQVAPSPSKSLTTTKIQSLVIPQDVGDDNLDMESSSTASPQSIVQPNHPMTYHNSKWTKDHPLNNIIGQLSRPVSTRLQLYEQALFCYYNAFLTSVKPKTYKEALTQACWIEAMHEELNKFERLEV
nr:retrovirus-related Pol polyprotein from transposon TNT 1-94 [Tanacetum cinerariifolium]